MESGEEEYFATGEGEEATTTDQTDHGEPKGAEATTDYVLRRLDDVESQT